MTTSDSYGYRPAGLRVLETTPGSDYSITSRNPLRFGSPPSRLGKPLCTTLGGAGLSVSARCAGPALDAAPRVTRNSLRPAPSRLGCSPPAGASPAIVGPGLTPKTTASLRISSSARLATLDRGLRAAAARTGNRIFRSAPRRLMDAYLRSRLSSPEALEALNELDRRLRLSQLTHRNSLMKDKASLSPEPGPPRGRRATAVRIAGARLQASSSPGPSATLRLADMGCHG